MLDFFASIEPFLERQGVKITSRDEEFMIGGAYSVTLNSKQYQIYSEFECEHAEIWELSTRRVYDIINELLANAHSTERIFLLYGGNDAEAVFLNPEMYRLIRDSPLIKEPEKPQDVGSSNR